MTVETSEVRSLLEQLTNVGCGFHRERIERKLDALVDRYRYGGEVLSEESRDESDDILLQLASRGSHSTREYMYG